MRAIILAIFAALFMACAAMADIRSGGVPQQAPDLEISTRTWDNSKYARLIVLPSLTVRGNLYILNLYTINK